MECYAAYAKDMTIRMMGSSGGLFPTLSQYHIQNGGVVYASVYDKDFIVRFCRLDTEEELVKSFSSKYVQSRMDNIFEQVEEDLRGGRDVLFCGTPCQVTALQNCLRLRRVDTEKFVALDLICHGVPGEYAFQKFMKRYSAPDCISLNMRNKEKGWNWGNFSWKVDFADGSNKIICQGNIPYMKGFLANLYLRHSCYECKTRGASAADLTLGDFWGISNVRKDIPADAGVSAVIERTEKGKRYLAQIRNRIECFEVSYQDIFASNFCLERSVKRPIYRKQIFKNLEKHDFDKVVLPRSQLNLKNRILNKLYSKLPKCKTSVSDLIEKGQRALYTKKEDCCGCMACVSICPINAISIKRDMEGFFYPVIDTQRCTGCTLCEKVCPFGKNSAR